MRDAINPSEEHALVAAVKSGKTWDEVRGLLHGVDPVALDRGFKERVFRLANVPLEVEEPAPEKPQRKARG